MSITLSDRDYCTLFRRKHNIKMKAIANYIGCSVSIISRWERGEGSLSDEKVNMYLKFITQYKENS